MAIYYVSNSGNDASSGFDANNAWQTIAKVNATSFNPGDTISFKCGDTWSENDPLTPPSSGASGNPIKFTSYGTGDAPIIKPNDGGAGVRRALFINTKNYITLEGLVFDGDNVTSLNDAGKITESTYITIERCTFKNGYMNGLHIGSANNPSYSTFTNCSFIDNGQIASNQYHGIYLETSNVTVENCIITGNHSVGVHIYSSDYACDNNIVRYCFVDGNDTGGILLSKGTGNKAYYNIVCRTAANPAIDCEYSGINSEVYNNTCYGNLSYAIHIGSGITGTIVRNNCLIGNNDEYVDYYDEGTGTTETNNIKDVDALYDPADYFVNAGGSYLLDTDFATKAEAASINAGIDVSLTEDYFGNPMVGVPDIGASEKQ